ncbi:hypothetical protein N7509_001222 [Penicillium cosmopolitanum]|uniref:Uncharacterized protein n=1 Tax=Penicillium cosmopolitanum TaxID=1131564 RepID=A0A9W9WBQ5_9EURO|nr:uncharacterized protein N7509_001222 [Penicillium cosmopolitanum]KAJ5414595.1 hypothetical protein N7509_001222 [Penicillium cosmopolitanum]
MKQKNEALTETSEGSENDIKATATTITEPTRSQPTTRHKRTEPNRTDRTDRKTEPYRLQTMQKERPETSRAPNRAHDRDRINVPNRSEILPVSRNTKPSTLIENVTTING